MVESATVSPPVTSSSRGVLEWTVIVEVELPSAVIVPGLAPIVEVAPEAGPIGTWNVTVAVLAIAVPLTVPLTTPLPTVEGAVSVAV